MIGFRPSPTYSVRYNEDGLPRRRWELVSDATGRVIYRTSTEGRAVMERDLIYRDQREGRRVLNPYREADDPVNQPQ